MLLPLLLLAGLFSACTVGGDDDPDYNERLLQRGEVAPDFTIITDEYPDGIALAGLRGSYVLIEFWRSTCGDCRDVTPDMKRIYGTYARADLWLWEFPSTRTRTSGAHTSKKTDSDGCSTANNGRQAKAL